MYETHPGDGQYDCLVIVGGESRVTINRVGSLRANPDTHGMSPARLSDSDWVQTAMDRGPSRMADDICAALGIGVPSPKPATTPRVLQYRVLARLLASRIFDKREWDARSAFFDSSGMDGSGIVGRLPSAEMTQIPANSLWRVLSAGEEVGWLWDGWAWNSVGERRDLMAAYARGFSIDSLVSFMTEPSTPRRADPIPPVAVSIERPIGTWP